MTTDTERREATDQWTIELREQQLHDLRAELTTANERNEQRRILLDDAQVLARDAQRRAADAEIALAAVTAERDDYRTKFYAMEREAELLRSQLIAMQLRAENAESALRSANVKIVRLEERAGVYSSQPRE